MQGVIFTADLSAIQEESREIMNILRIENGVCKGLLDNAFRNGEVLTNITIPDSVTSIGDNAFRGCTGLKSVYIGNSVTSIGDNAFRDCTDLTIYGTRGSYAETYAKENNIQYFVSDI